MGVADVSEGKKRVDERILKLLENPPKFEGYSIEQLADKLAQPWSSVKWHLSLMEARHEVQHLPVGRAKIYSLRKRA